MQKEIINSKYGEIPVLTNESKSKKVLIYFHGLDGSAGFSKPLFKNLDEYKIVAMESRGHNNSTIKSSRLISKHITDYISVIKHYKKLNMKVWVIGESMGAGYVAFIAYKYPQLIEGVFVWSIPNKLVNIMAAPKWKQMKIQTFTLISFLTNINYKYQSSVNYEKLSNNKTLHRIARMADKNKIRQVRETLATWSITKKAWRLIRSSKPLEISFNYYQPKEDIIVNLDKVKKAFEKGNNKNKTLKVLPNSKHILMYEPEFETVLQDIKSTLSK